MDKKFSRESVLRPHHGPKKRKFHGNRYTDEQSSTFASTSAKKLKDSGDKSFDVHYDQSMSYCIIQFALVFSNLQTILKCKQCNEDVTFTQYAQRGLGFKISVQCSCGETLINSCPMIDNAYEINRRFVFAMRLIGIGIHGIKNFCGLMDFGQGFNITTYYRTIENISVAVKTVFDIVISKAVSEEKTLNSQAGYPQNELAVSGDGSWSKRGFSSLLGLVSLIGKYSNKILDIVVKSSTCKACEYWKGKEDTIDYEAWYEDHKQDCNANHEGSAGKMEVDGVVEMFQRSEEKDGVKYAYYIGDGDTKTFKTLLDTKCYGDNFIVKKKECILHVQKRMFRKAKEAKKQLTQLKKAKKQADNPKEKNTKSKRKRSIQSAPKTVQLTNKLMKDLSTYYGLAIRRHPESIEDMRNAVWATYYHKISTDKAPQHSHCPAGTDSWCEWRKSEAAGLLDSYEHPPALDEEVQQILKPIYEELSSDDLLERCLGSNTQNNNESFNSCVWNLAPKHVFCGKKVLEIAAYTAACIFNEGFQPILKMMDVMGVKIGPHAIRFAKKYNDERICTANRRSSEASKEVRTARRNARADAEDMFEETEGLLYGAGIAD